MGLSSRPSADDFALFNVELGSMVRSGLPIHEGLRSLAHQARSTRFRELLETVSGNLVNGQSLSQALSQHPSTFSPYYIALIRAGEEGGNLIPVLEHLTWYSRWKLHLRRQMFNVLTYPILVIGFFFVILFMVTYSIVPKFIEIYTGFGAMLPPMTRIIVHVSNLVVSVVDNYPLILLVFVLLFFAFLLLDLKGYLRTLLDGLLMRIPILGRVIRYQYLAHFCTALGQMLRSGVSTPTALEILEHSIEGIHSASIIREVNEGVKEGSSLSREMSRFTFFPSSLIWMVENSEKKEDLPTTLEDIGHYYQEVVEDETQQRVILFEPIVIIILGFVIGFTVLALYMPVFKLVEVIK